MLFAAGLGTRLRPLTDHMPKALVPVGGRPLLDITASRLREAGVDTIVVNVHHFANQIVDYFSQHDLGINITISDESQQLLDTGGGLKKALAIFEDLNKTASSTIAPHSSSARTPAGSPTDPILIHNVDILSNADLAAFYNENRDVDVALMVSPRKTQRYLLFNDDMRLVGWTNVATGEIRSPYPELKVEACHMYAFSGIHLVTPGIRPEMETWPEKFPIMDFYLAMCDKLHIRGVLNEELRLLDVGKQDTLKAAEDFLQTL